ncbi:hypothetical protein BDW71DRAFT_207965 [Aspergillus fruticulosus]
MKPSLAFGLALATTLAPSAQARPYPGWEPCPRSCEEAGLDPAKWTQYHELRDLDYCVNKTLIFDLPLYNPVDSTEPQFNIRACASDQPVLVASRNSQSNVTATATDVRLSLWGPTKDRESPSDLISAWNALKAFMTHGDQLEPTILLAKMGNAVAGVYAGSQVERDSATKIVQALADYVSSANGVLPQQIAAQLCPKSKAISSQIVGIVANFDNDVASVQDALGNWDNAECVTVGAESEETLANMKIGIVPALIHSGSQELQDRSSMSSLQRRATCDYVKAGAGDGCWALAEKCGITQAQLDSYNDGLCSKTVQNGQAVCCSPGTLPDFSPKPGADGTCATYSIKTNDLCSTIASANYLTVEKIKTYNEKTWGWAGCEHLQVGQKICLSTGSPPWPAAMEGAVCGPQVAGTERPADNVDWASVNPCPLNACCDIWGQCGITPEFCTPSPADTGNPGTAQPNTNGCISHCGTEITNNDEIQTTIKMIGYFEAWNLDRPCLHMDISKVQDGLMGYTHIHFAFADITTDFQVDVSSVQDQFDGLLELPDVAKVLSFGGWSFSTDLDTFPIFRQGVSDANRDAFANAVVAFAVEHDLDGLDFDWEYPGAPDIPGIPAGDEGDGERYLQFLKTVRSRLPASKTLSIAAPASYWYLKGFPIKEMSEVVDYIVFMTYDLHGQWDYGNAFVNPGCENGNCLRSHVNLTETNYALAMITKAGVPAKKVVPGIAGYGRSFKMNDPGCKGPECTFSGPDSGATPGECTDTAGYLSYYEIQQIIRMSQAPDVYGDYPVTQYQDEGDILIYEDDQWVSYMTVDTILERVLRYTKNGFGGSVTWAADLMASFGDNGTGGMMDESTDDEGTPCILTNYYYTLEDLAQDAPNHPATCNEIYAVDTLMHMFDDLYSNYTSTSNGYDDKFDAYVRYIKDVAPMTIDNYFITPLGDDGSERGYQYFDCHYVTEPATTVLDKRCDEFTDDELLYGSYSIYMTLRDADAARFNETFLNVTGIEPDWITFTDTRTNSQFCDHTSCPPNTGSRTRFNYPGLRDDVQIPDPKDMVADGIGNVQETRKKLLANWIDMAMGNWDADMSDIVQVMSVPVFLLEQAVESMTQVKIIGEEQEELEEKEKRNFILGIVGAMLCVVPYIGEVGLLAAGATNLARVAAIAGEVANTAFGIYEMVEDPDSALMSVMGMLFGAGGVAAAARDGAGMAKMANARRGLTAADIEKLGAVFVKRDKVLQSIVRRCS